MKKILVIFVFMMGLGVFLYPIISNMLSTKEHHTMISNYNEKIKQMKVEQIEAEKKKVNEHNSQLAKSEVDFVDPFSNRSSSEGSAGNKSYYDALNIDPAIGSIRIPKINVELPIFHGTGEKVLSRGVGHLENSSLPSDQPGTHSVLTAHRGLPSSKLFRNLDELTVGDQFYVQVLDKTLTYEVDQIRTVLPDETDWLQMDENENIMTLLTCEPYMINTHRLLVTGHVISYEEKQQYSQANPNENSYSTTFTPLYVLGALAAVSIVVWQVWRRKKRRGTHGEE